MGRSSEAREKLMDAVLELIWHGSFGSTTIDQICEKSGVRKGSFYHFFESKSDLATAALEASWAERRADLDALFSPTLPPLERLHQFCETAYQRQVALRAECGCVLGCPLFTLGAEICNQEVRLLGKIKEIFQNYHQYLESAIRDAQREGSIPMADPAAKARMLFAYFEGLMTQARILNDPRVLREMSSGMLDILGHQARQAA